MLPSPSRRRSPTLYLVAAASLSLLVFLWHRLAPANAGADFLPDTVQLAHHFGQPATADASKLTTQPKPQADLPCSHLPGGEDVLLVLKTGATEVREKLPVHLETTLRCVPHYAVFSDMDEVVAGVRVHDVLADVDEKIRNTNADFRYYRRLQEHRDQGKSVADMADSTHKQAWNLDKWKYLPMMDRALKARPNAKWYVFMEADTYLVWANLLQWLRLFDPDKPLYIGGQNWMMNHLFAHGGTGFIVSNMALRMVVEQRRNNLATFDQLTAQDYAGDLVLAKAFETVGLSLTPSWPLLQRETPYTLDYTKHNWCFPVVTYHRMAPEWIKAMWDFEQSWMSQSQPSVPILRHRDVFAHVVAPQIATEKNDWDNLSDDYEETPVDYSLQGCREACAARSDCLQYLSSPGRCQTGKVIRLGAAGSERDPGNLGQDSTSGWVVERVNDFIQSVEPCMSDHWITAGS